MKTKNKRLAEQIGSIRVITDINGSQFVLADEMYSASKDTTEKHHETGTQFLFYLMREPSLTRAVVRRVLKTKGRGKTRWYETNLWQKDGVETLDIGCKRFQGAALVALKRWANFNV